MYKHYIYIIFLLCVIALIPSKTYAIDSGYAGWDSFDRVDFDDCENYNSCTTNVGITYNSVYNNAFKIATNNRALYFGSVGVGFRFVPNTAISNDYLYSVSMVVCFDNVYITNYRWFSAGNVDSGHLSEVLWTNNYAINNEWDIPFSKCRQLNSIQRPRTGSWIGIQAIGDDSSYNEYMTAVAYKVDVLGRADNLSSSDIQNVISSSNLATASDVEELDTAITEVKREITVLNNSVDNQTQVIENTLTSEELPTNEIDDSLVPSDSPVSDLVTLPITFLQTFLNIDNTSCSAYNFGSLYNHNITFPCINVRSIVGDTLYTIIDYLFAFYMVYNIGKLIVSAYNKITSLHDMYNELYGGDSQ